MGRWCIAIASLWVFGWGEVPSASAASTSHTVDVSSAKASSSIENRRKKRTKYKAGSPAVRGFCAKSDVKSKVRRRSGAIRACYEKQLMRNPKLAGKVTARWTIAKDGRVMGAVRANGLGAVGNCIAQKIRVLRFKPPEGGICLVQMPFVFSSR